MPTAVAHVATTRAARYLAQLRDHTGRLPAAAGHGQNAPETKQTQHSQSEAVIDFGWARCTLTATDDALILRGEADDPDRLAQLKESLTRTLERIGRRDRLAVTWTSSGNEAAALLNDLMTPQGRADPYPYYAAAHELGPVSSIADGYVLVAGYDAVNEVLRDPGFGLAEPHEPAPENTNSDTPDALRSMAKSILRANPPDHSRMRSLIAQVFTPRRVATLQPAIEAAVERLLERLAISANKDTAVDFMDSFAFPLPVTVICELLGIPEADRERFRPLAADLTEALELSTDLSTAADSAARELAGYFTGVIAERRARPTDDLIGALVAARDADGDRLSEEELLANLILLLVAGFETTTSLLGNGLAVLLADPRLADAMRSGQVPVAAFVEEVLRFDSPVQVTTRIARADKLTVAGHPVPQGTQAVLLIGAANRDPRRYPDPDRFDAGRIGVKPLSFGAGPHICLGNSLARLEATIAFARILGRFPGIAFAPGHRPTRRDRLVLRGFETLPIGLGAWVSNDSRVAV